MGRIPWGQPRGSDDGKWVVNTDGAGSCLRKICVLPGQLELDKA